MFNNQLIKIRQIVLASCCSNFSAPDLIWFLSYRSSILMSLSSFSRFRRHRLVSSNGKCLNIFVNNKVFAYRRMYPVLIKINNLLPSKWIVSNIQSRAYNSPLNSGILCIILSEIIHYCFFHQHQESHTLQSVPMAILFEGLLYVCAYCRQVANLFQKFNVYINNAKEFHNMYNKIVKLMFI